MGQDQDTCRVEPPASKRPPKCQDVVAYAIREVVAYQRSDHRGLIAGGCSIVLIYAQMNPQTPNALFKNAAINFKRLKCSHDRKFRVVSPAV